MRVEPVLCGGILQTMRFAALVLVLVITAIASADPICCADGCTRTDLAAGNHPAPSRGDCPICQPGAVEMTPQLPVASLELGSAALPVDRVPLDWIPRVIEHPPRS